MVRISELKTRDVVNITDGRRMGEIKDIDLDVESGRLSALILPAEYSSGGFLGLWARNEDLIIPWNRVRKIGVDVILVEMNNYTEPKIND